MQLQMVDGVAYARSVQGHSWEALMSAGVKNPDEGVMGLAWFPPPEQVHIYYGFNAYREADLRREGILCGGTEGYRLSIHCTFSQAGYVDPLSGQAYQGTKGNAYAEIDVHRLVKIYRANGNPIRFYVNKSGVILLRGAVGVQEHPECQMGNVETYRIPPDCWLWVRQRVRDPGRHGSPRGLVCSSRNFLHVWFP